MFELVICTFFFFLLIAKYKKKYIRKVVYISKYLRKKSIIIAKYERSHYLVEENLFSECPVSWNPHSFISSVFTIIPPFSKMSLNAFHLLI